MKLMLLVIIILVILCTLLAFGVSKLYDYLKYKEEYSNLKKQAKIHIRENKLNIKVIEHTINAKKEMIKDLEESLGNRAELKQLNVDIKLLNKLIKDIEGEK